jgi:hypothetical protein
MQQTCSCPSSAFSDTVSMVLLKEENSSGAFSRNWVLKKVSTEHMFFNRLSKLFKWNINITGNFPMLFQYTSHDEMKPFEPHG